MHKYIPGRCHRGWLSSEYRRNISGLKRTICRMERLDPDREKGCAEERKRGRGRI
jgi:hypothetical protein